MMEWKPFLERWSRELLQTELAQRLDPAPAEAGWLGFAPATEADIAALETKLGMRLPPSYKSFLLTTNGWRRTSFFIGHVRAASEVDWFSVENEQWAAVFAEAESEEEDETYYRYTAGAASNHRAAHMATLLQISDVEDGVYLLNPQAVTSNGEWEAWFFANWVPGAVRYPSFAHLMLYEYRSFRKLQEVPGKVPRLPRLAMPDPGEPRTPAEGIGKRRRPKAILIAELLEQMESATGPELAKAVRAFCGKQVGRRSAVRQLELVPRLEALFRRHEDPSVRAACIAALTELSEDASPVLLEALSDPDGGVVLSGIFALTDFPDRRAVDPLCRFIASGVNPLFAESAMSQLGEMGDPAAVPTLVAVLRNTQTSFPQNIGTAGYNLGRCGPAGVDVLIDALASDDERVRHAAVVGLYVSGDPRAAAHLRRMLDDPSDKVRERASMALRGTRP